MPRPLADDFRAARRDPALVVIEGFHAVKHALRFGARIERVVATTDADLKQLAAALAPDVAAPLGGVERLADLAPLVPRRRAPGSSPSRGARSSPRPT